MNILAALFLLIGTQAYTAPTPDGRWLYTQDGTFSIELGSSCDWIQGKMNVDYQPGTGDVITIYSLDGTLVCNAQTTRFVSYIGCAMNDDLLCDVDADTNL